jgi:hypothetical protein
MRRVYTMTDEQLQTLLNAMKPVPMIMLQCGTPPSQQENANDAWKWLGNELGFVWDTVRPHGSDSKMFTAIPKERQA